MHPVDYSRMIFKNFFNQFESGLDAVHGLSRGIELIIDEVKYNENYIKAIHEELDKLTKQCEELINGYVGEE
jgi:hypothetical protein